MHTKLRAFAGAILFGLVGLGSAAAQDYPSKPIEIVVPASAGGGTDVLVRVLQPYLEQELGGTIVVLNVPGSGTVGGSRRVVEAEPDGHTVLANHVTLLTAMALKKADFTYTDFALAATAVDNPLVVVVPADSPLTDIKSLLERGKDTANPLIAGVNLGAVNHFALLMLQSQDADAQFRFVQTGGGAETSAALLGRHIGVGVLGSSEARPLIESGDVRVIAALGSTRVPYFPDAPTAEEQGYDISLTIEHFWFMPAGTPPERVERFGAALGAVLAKPEVVETLNRQGLFPTYETGAASWSRLESLYSTLETIAAEME